MKFGHISLSVRIIARGRAVLRALFTKLGKSSGLYTRMSRSETSFSAIFQPVELVVEKTNLTDGSTLRHSRMSCPATCTSPTETACTQTDPPSRSARRTFSGYSANLSPIRAAYPPRLSMRTRKPGRRNG